MEQKITVFISTDDFSKLVNELLSVAIRNKIHPLIFHKALAEAKIHMEKQFPTTGMTEEFIPDTEGLN